LTHDSSNEQRAERRRKGTIYRYFPSKEKLFMAVADQAMTDLLQAAYSKALLVSDPIERVRTGVREYFRFFDEHRELVDIFAQERSEFRDRVEPTFLVFRDSSTAQLATLLNQLKKDGVVRDIDTDLAASLFGDMLAGAVYTHYRIGSGPLVEQTDSVMDLFLHGILQPNAASQSEGEEPDD